MYEIEPLDKQRPTEISTIPKPPFTYYICASKGSGKTTLLLNLLTKAEFYKNKFNQVYFISPTAKLDEKLNVLKEKDIMIPNKPLIQLTKKLQQKKKNKIMDDIDEKKGYITLEDYPTKMTKDNFINKFSVEWFEDIVETNNNITENFGKQFADKILLIFDDSISDKIFKSKKMEEYILTSRHINLSVIIISQSFYLLPKTLRNNNSVVVLFETGNVKELQDIYKENDTGLSWKEFLTIYKDVMKTKYNFLVFNYQNDREYRLQEQFKHFITIE